MPIYDFKCIVCGITTETIQGVNTTHPICQCGGYTYKLIPTGTHFNLKGEDWVDGGFH